MQVFLVTLTLLVSFSELTIAYEACNNDNCRLPSCRCANFDIPGGLSPNETPQFLIFSIEGPITANTIDGYYTILRSTMSTNPDSCRYPLHVSSDTLYTNFVLAEDLYKSKTEMSIPSDYSKGETVEELTEEYGYQRDYYPSTTIIPANKIKGVVDMRESSPKRRQNLLKMMSNSEFSYDFTNRDFPCVPRGIWPYTLDFNSFPGCDKWDLDTPYPGIWMFAPNFMTDEMNSNCPTIDSCGINIPSDREAMKDWLIKQLHSQMTPNRAPIVMRINSSWFFGNTNARSALWGLTYYINYMQRHVFAATPSYVLDWMKNPRTITEMKNNPKCFENIV